MSFKNMTVSAKLSAAFGSLVLTILLVAGLSLKSLADANERFTNYLNGINARAVLAESVRTAVDRRAIAVRDLVLVAQADDGAAERREAMTAQQDVQGRLAKLEEMARAPEVPDEVRALIARMEEVEKAYSPIALHIVQLAQQGKRAEAIAEINGACRPRLSAMIKATQDYLAFTAGRQQLQIDHAEASYSRQRRFLIAACLAAVVAAALAGMLITRSLTRALGAEPAELGAAAQRVAQGDLAELHGARVAPAGSVLESLGAMQVNLARIVGQVRDASESIATGSAQIAAGNTDLSQRTEEQASALQQTSATMDELGSTVRHNAANAQQANQLAAGASDVATRGGSVVSRVVATMKGINDSSRRIADIIGVIDGIAFQTNILALNAAVEAARAGEQGRGFAVVASEVRSLAQRSAAAAKEIKGLIGGSVEQVDAGSKLVDEAGLTMNEIVAAIKRVTEIVGEISVASVQQSSGVDQVGQAVTQMDQVTQQNAALVEESAAAAESLNRQAHRLVDVVAVFTGLQQRDPMAQRA